MTDKRTKEIAVIRAARKLRKELESLRAATVPEYDYAPWVPAFDKLDDALFELDQSTDKGNNEKS